MRGGGGVGPVTRQPRARGRAAPGGARRPTGGRCRGGGGGRGGPPEAGGGGGRRGGGRGERRRRGAPFPPPAGARAEAPPPPPPRARGGGGGGAVRSGRSWRAGWTGRAGGGARRRPAILQGDPGMARFGFAPDEVGALLDRPDALAGLDLRLVMSHLACAGEPDSPVNAAQLSVFRA
ncbi:alanine racemase, partial [Methylobacterium radiotolerans]|uniref:alanine racemase n=1 Tax=Methylobacterium radiotolerans TaxID=31998 RepID=UPI003F661379